MNDLVKRLRDINGGWAPDLALETADRIEHLEQELADIKKADTYMDEQHQDCRNQLAAEKALADILAEDLECYRAEIDPDCKDHCCQYARETEAVLAAYRKARGL